MVFRMDDNKLGCILLQTENKARHGIRMIERNLANFWGWNKFFEYNIYSKHGLSFKNE